jgi:HK97 family phage major capsid protein
MPATDAMIARLEADLEERNAFIEGLIAGAQDGERDLNTQEMELITNARTRIAAVGAQLEPLRETSRITIEARSRAREINDEMQSNRMRLAGVKEVEYRSCGAYIADRYLALMGDDGAMARMEMFNRAAAHQTTADNPGLLPERIVEPVINLVDNSRPIVTTLGPQDLGNGSWAYAKVTQHTQVGVQSAEKAELPSQRMTITKTPLTAPTYGGYVNVSRQDISRTTPAILDMVVNDLATEYAIQTETAAGATLIAGSTAGTNTGIAAGTTPAQMSAYLWGAAATAYAAMRGQGQLYLAVSPDQMGLVGPLFAPVNPQNAFGSGFEAGSFGAGAMGAISGIAVIMSPTLPAKSQLVINSRAVRVFEMRYGALQVVEPSVWGVQVGYAGDFQTIVIEPGGVIKLVVT